MKILTIVGARPQFIKAAVVSRALSKHNSFNEIIVHTGQHFDDNMSEIFFREMEIPKPPYNLGVHSLTHGAMTARMLEGIETILIKEKPDLLMVYGDTNSTLAGALAAKKLLIPVAHVEAGLRSFNLKMPEEINRILTDRIADILYCPTETAVNNLFKEGFKNFPCEIIRNGDVMQDAAIYYSQLSAERSGIIKKINLKSFILCTIHRQENTDDENKLKSIIHAINKIHAEIPVVLPLHPRTQNILKKSGIKTNATLIDPVGYFDMIELIRNCSLVMTDSGGLQKEAFFFKKHCITLRDETEWTELVEHGFNELAGADENIIYNVYQTIINKHSDFSVDLYGNGLAAEKLVDHLLGRI